MNTLTKSTSNDQGKSWFGGLVKAIAQVAITVVGTSIGGPVGGLVAAYASSYLDDIWPTHWQRGEVGSTNGTNGFSGRPTDEEAMKAFVENIFQPWFLKITFVLKESENINVLKSASYRSYVNRVLKDLEVLRIYYQKQSQESSDGTLGAKGGFGGDVNVEDIKTKEKIFSAFQNSVREAYAKAMLDVGETVNRETTNFSTQSHSLSKPFTIPLNLGSLNGVSNLEIFVGKGSSNDNNNNNQSFEPAPTKDNGYQSPPINPNTNDSNEEVPVKQTITSNSTTSSNPESKKQNYLVPALTVGSILAFFAFSKKKK